MPEIKPSKEVLNALQLTLNQFRFGMALIATPAGLSRDTLWSMNGLSDGEVRELVTRGFISQKGNQYHVTAMGSGLLQAIADFVAATS